MKNISGFFVQEDYVERVAVPTSARSASKMDIMNSTPEPNRLDIREVGKGALVSVIIPTYNRAPLLSRALQSVRIQTYKDIETIVVDDASLDGTKDLLESMLSPGIRYLRHPVRKGVAAARNTGIRASRGSYIAFLDSDDEWAETKIEKQMKAFQLAVPSTGVVYSATRRVLGPKIYQIPDPDTQPKEGNLYSSILRGTYLVPTPSALVKKECLDTVGLFDESFDVLEEWDLWIRISRQYQFKFIDEPLLTSYFTSGSLSTDRLAFYKATRMVLKKYCREIKRNPGLLLSIYHRLARLYVGHWLHRIGIIR